MFHRLYNRVHAMYGRDCGCCFTYILLVFTDHRDRGLCNVTAVTWYAVGVAIGLETAL